MDPRPVGVFDSGAGGLTVLHECLVTMPHEDFVYLGDGARCPYGPREPEEIGRFALEIASYLERSGVLGLPMIVIGFTESHGWTHTVNNIDLEDFFALTIDPDRPDHYILDGKSMPLMKKEVAVEVKGADGQVSSVVLRDTRSGELRDLMAQGPAYLKGRGLATDRDIEHTEARGRLDGAEPDNVSDRALDRGAEQCGTLGSGNHFLEVQVVEQLADPETANEWGLREGLLAVTIHCGSRGLGHQVCTDHVKGMQKAMDRYGIAVPDRQLACVPVRSPEGERYLQAMAAWGGGAPAPPPARPARRRPPPPPRAPPPGAGGGGPAGRPPPRAPAPAPPPPPATLSSGAVAFPGELAGTP
jgi:hypothetical protein